MTLDARIRSAQKRLHRSIGQRARRAHEDIRRMADEARMELGPPIVGRWIVFPGMPW